MYTPARFQETDNNKIFEVIRQNPFATIVSHDGEKPIATHLPIELETGENDKLFLTGHVARANEQWKTFDENKEILAIFTGAHAYISPRWYSDPLENVPTWNYSAVHVYGKPRLITEKAGLFGLLKKLVDRYEQGTNYKLEDVAPDYVEKLLSGIVGFQIEVTNIESTFKFSQHHRNLPHYENVIAELKKLGDDNSIGVAAAMQENK